MASKPNPPAVINGPFLQIACLCEKVLTEVDGALSLIRVVDQIVQTASGVEPPEQMPPFVVSGIKLVIALKSGEARGRYAIRIRPEDPSGVQLPAIETAVQLEPGNRGVNVVSDLQFAVQHEGVYWFDVFFVRGKGDEMLLTRVPLQVVYQPQQLAPSGDQ